MIGAAQLPLDHRQALEAAADRQLFRHAHAAMQLDRVLADEAAGAADRDLGGADHPSARGRMPVDRGDRPASDGRGPARVDIHVDEAVLHHLELAQRLTELATLLGVFDRVPHQPAHQAGGLDAESGDGLVADEIEVDGHRRRDLHVGEGNVGGHAPIDRRHGPRG